MTILVGRSSKRIGDAQVYGYSFEGSGGYRNDPLLLRDNLR